MKKLILILLFIPLVSFGQISISDLIKVGKMDMESFEIYATKHWCFIWFCQFFNRKSNVFKNCR